VERSKNTVQRYAQKHSPTTLERDEALLLDAMTKASYRILGIEFIEVGVGMYCRDLLRGQRLFLMDKGFSNTTTPGCVLASNVLDLPEFSMTAGGALPIDRAYAKRLLAVCAQAVGAPTWGTRLISWARGSPTRGRFMTCSGTCGSGAGTGTAMTTMPRAPGMTRRGLLPALTACCEAGRGPSPTHCSAAHRAAAVAFRRSGTGTSAFGW